MKKNVWDIRVPTIFALLFIIGSIWATLIAIQKGVFIVGKAAPENEPLNITFGNITDTSFRIGFTTKEKVIAAVKITGNNGVEKVQFDDRDKTEQNAYFTHIHTFKNLAPSSKYTVSILLEGKTYPQSGQKELEIKTAPQIEERELGKYKIQGTVLDENGNLADDFLVVIFLDGAQTLLTLSVNGTYSFDFEKIRSADLDSYITPKEGARLKLSAFQKNLSANVSTQFTNELSLPPIVFSQNYSLLENIPTPKESTPSSNLVIPTPKKRSNGALSISIPRDNQSFIDNQPVFRGTAQPNKDVFIFFENPPAITAKVLSDNLGFWSFRPASPLSQGNHTMKVESADNFGIKKSVVRSFSIFASGSQVTESATPSATPIVTSAPTATPLPTSVATPTVTPIVKASATPTLFPTATFTPAPTLAQNTLTPTPFLSITPTSPGSVSSILVTLVSVLFIITGTTLLFILS